MIAADAGCAIAWEVLVTAGEVLGRRGTGPELVKYKVRHLRIAWQWAEGIACHGRVSGRFACSCIARKRWMVFSFHVDGPDVSGSTHLSSTPDRHGEHLRLEREHRPLLRHATVGRHVVVGKGVALTVDVRFVHDA